MARPASTGVNGALKCVLLDNFLKILGEQSTSETGSASAQQPLFFANLTLITRKLKGKNVTLHIPGSFRNIYGIKFTFKPLQL